VRVLVSRPAWKDYQVTQEREEGKDREQKHMACMLHITPASIIETNEEYRAWMHSFGPATQVKAFPRKQGRRPIVRSHFLFSAYTCE